MENFTATMSLNETTSSPHFQKDCNGSVFVNGTVDCDESYQEFLKSNDLIFNESYLIKVVVILVIFLLSITGNSIVLASVTAWRTNNIFTHTQLLVTHLSLANLCFTVFVLLMDAVWNITMQWYGGTALCRILNSTKQFGMYISSAVIVVMAIDKASSLIRPCSPNQHLIRIKRFMSVAWIFSFLNCIPASFVFSADNYPVFRNCKQCEHIFFAQCTDKGHINNTWKRVFFFYTSFISFFIPMLIIIVCYIVITIALTKMAKRAKVTEKQSSGFRTKRERKSLVRQSLGKAKKVSQILTALVIASFTLCWGPYYIVGIIEHNETLGVLLRVMLMSSYLNPCIHPLIAVLLMKDVRKSLNWNFTCKRRSPRNEQQNGVPDDEDRKSKRHMSNNKHALELGEDLCDKSPKTGHTGIH